MEPFKAPQWSYPKTWEAGKETLEEFGDNLKSSFLNKLDLFFAVISLLTVLIPTDENGVVHGDSFQIPIMHLNQGIAGISWIISLAKTFIFKKGYNTPYEYGLMASASLLPLIQWGMHRIVDWDVYA